MLHRTNSKGLFCFLYPSRKSFHLVPADLPPVPLPFPPSLPPPPLALHSTLPGIRCFSVVEWICCCRGQNPPSNAPSSPATLLLCFFFCLLLCTSLAGQCEDVARFLERFEETSMDFRSVLYAEFCSSGCLLLYVSMNCKSC